jgi:hypothetical protein
VLAARSFYEHRHEQLQQLGSSFHLAQLEPFLNLFTQGTVDLGVLAAAGTKE